MPACVGISNRPSVVTSLMATRIRMRELTRVFGPTAPFSARYIGQLSVLYEDLRIETRAIAEDSMPSLDVTDADWVAVPTLPLRATRGAA